MVWPSVLGKATSSVCAGASVLTVRVSSLTRLVSTAVVTSLSRTVMVALPLEGTA